MDKLCVTANYVLKCLASDMFHWQKLGIFPAHKRILNELHKKFKIRRSSRTLMRWLRSMEDAGLIRRRKRHRYDGVNKWEFRSSLYIITRKGWYLLRRAGFYTINEINRLWGIAKARQRQSREARAADRPPGDLTHVGGIMKGLLFNTS